MSAILGFFLIILVIVFVIGFSIISGVLRLLFGIGKKQSYYSGKSSENSSQNKHGYQRSSENEDQNIRKKIFGDDEGEYVDFEEIKENDKK